MEAKKGTWYAWINMMPPPPDDFHVVGTVELPSPAYQAKLVKKIPQGINPIILLLELIVIETIPTKPVLEVVVEVQVRYDEILTKKSTRYSEVHIFQNGQIIEKVPVEIVS